MSATGADTYKYEISKTTVLLGASVVSTFIAMVTGMIAFSKWEKNSYYTNWSSQLQSNLANSAAYSNLTNNQIYTCFRDESRAVGEIRITNYVAWGEAIFSTSPISFYRIGQFILAFAVVLSTLVTIVAKLLGHYYEEEYLKETFSLTNAERKNWKTTETGKKHNTKSKRADWSGTAANVVVPCAMLLWILAGDEFSFSRKLSNGQVFAITCRPVLASALIGAIGVLYVIHTFFFLASGKEGSWFEKHLNKVEFVLVLALIVLWLVFAAKNFHAVVEHLALVFVCVATGLEGLDCARKAWKWCS